MFRSTSLFQPMFMRRYDQAHSPLHIATQNTQELRSKLFPERRRIPGRKGKILVALGFVLQAWGIQHVIQVRRQFKHKELELKKLQRKSAPFLQAMADIRYCSIADKRDILISELFAERGEEYVKDLTNIYYQKDIWAPFKGRSPHQNARNTKDPYPYFDIPATRILHGYDLYNI